MDGQVVVLVLATALVVAALLLMRLRDRSGGADTGAESSAPTSSPTDAATQAIAARITTPTVDRASLRTARLGRTPFAVVDVETTGFDPVPGGTHRIVEVAVVRMSPDGRVEDEFVTLVKPQRRMGASHI